MTEKQENKLENLLKDRFESCVCLGRQAYGNYIKKQVKGAINDFKTTVK